MKLNGILFRDSDLCDEKYKLKKQFKPLDISGGRRGRDQMGKEDKIRLKSMTLAHNWKGGFTGAPVVMLHIFCILQYYIINIFKREETKPQLE